MSSNKFLFVNGVLTPSSDTPTAASFLESLPGAYTTTRTHNDGSVLLFWERHLRRIANSARILFNANPELLFKSVNSFNFFSSQLAQPSVWEPTIRALVNGSMGKVLQVALEERRGGEELSITTLVSGNCEKLSDIQNVDEETVSRVFDVYVHVGAYVPPVFGIPENAAHLALVGRGRDVANAKHSEWVRLRKPLEKMRPPWATELLLSNDGDRILEGSVTNLFVVCRKVHNDNGDDAWGNDTKNYNSFPFEIQTAPLGDGVLPGVIRQVIIDICLRKEIPLQEVAPSWSEHEIWEEAFVTNGLRLLQHVETIQVPSSWELLKSKSWEDVTWEEKRFKGAPGSITTMIQKEIMNRVAEEGHAIALFRG